MAWCRGPVIKKGPIYVQLGYYLGQPGQPNLGEKNIVLFSSGGLAHAQF